ncbi:MAG: M3 family oligoendopeptidase, partial [Candidatus Enteromonas sp.]
MPNKEIPTFEEWPFRVPNLEKAAASAKAATAALEAAQTPEEALKVFKKHEKESDLLGNACTHAFVLFTLDSTNKKYAKAVAKIDEGMPLVQVEENHFAEAMLHSPHRAYLEKKLGTHLFTMYEYSLKGFDDRVVAEAVEENKLSTEYGAKLAAIRVTYKGQEYNLPQMGKFLQDLDRDVRKEASQAYYAALSTHVEELEDIYDRLVHVRDAIAKKLGYKNFVELGYIRMQRYDYNVEDVRAYREAIHDVVTPIAAKIMKAQFKRTGIRKPEIYDNSLVFKTGNPMPKGTTADKIELAKKMYDALSPETSYFFRFMADHHVLDLEARPGKQGGGYMTYFPKYGIPFIFSNFNGTKGDIDVLTHEFGHSFQAYMARKIKVPELRQPTSEGCEIDSMSMEFFAHPWMDLFFDEPEKYRYAHLADAISFLPYGVTVDHFQEWVYENPNATKA